VKLQPSTSKCIRFEYITRVGGHRVAVFMPNTHNSYIYMC